MTEKDPGRKIIINTIQVRYIGTFRGEKVDSVTTTTQVVHLPPLSDPNSEHKTPSELILGRGGKGLDSVIKTLDNNS